MKVTRRRFVAVLATSTLTGSIPVSAITRQRFYALGAEAKITLAGNNKHAEAALQACRKEVAAIESAFSLYDSDSLLSRLNRDGSVRMNGLFKNLLRHSLHMAEITDGAFDPTVQPLWQAYANGSSVRQARQLVDWRRLQFTSQSAFFTKQGMAASFNGIAQGFAADRVSVILAEFGFENTLVNLGEFAVRGEKQAGPWRLGIRDPLSGQVVATVESSDGAIATSEPHGTLIAGRSHLFDPLEQLGERWLSVTVEAQEAWRADALSTAVAASPVEKAETLLAAGNATRAWLISSSGTLVTI